MVITLESSDPSISLFVAVISTFYNPISVKYCASYPKTIIPAINTMKKKVIIQWNSMQLCKQSINGCNNYSNVCSDY